MSLAWQPPARTSADSYARGEKPAGGDEKRAAAHRRIDDPQLQDAIGRGVAHQRAERAAHQIVGDRLRRVEACRSPCARRSRARSDDGCRRVDARLVVEQRFVDGAELLDAEIAIGDPLAARAVGSRPRRQRDDRPPRRLVVQVAPLGERRSRRREQPSVERRHPQIAGAAAGVREPRDRAQRVPEARRAAATARPRRAAPRGCSSRGRSDATAAPARALRRTAGTASDRRSSAPVRSCPCDVDGVRAGHWRRDQRAQDLGRRGEHAVAQRSADAGRVPIGCGDQRVQRPRIVGVARRAPPRRRAAAAAANARG